MYRVYTLGGWYIVSYALGIYLLNVLMDFLSPLSDPAEEEGTLGHLQFVHSPLCSRSVSVYFVPTLELRSEPMRALDFAYHSFDGLVLISNGFVPFSLLSLTTFPDIVC